jgi:hypothetical protein
MNRGDPEWVNGEVIAYAWLETIQMSIGERRAQAEPTAQRCSVKPGRVSSLTKLMHLTQWVSFYWSVYTMHAIAPRAKQS